MRKEREKSNRRTPSLFPAAHDRLQNRVRPQEHPCPEVSHQPGIPPIHISLTPLQIPAVPPDSIPHSDRHEKARDSFAFRLGQRGPERTQAPLPLGSSVQFRQLTGRRTIMRAPSPHHASGAMSYRLNRAGDRVAPGRPSPHSCCGADRRQNPLTTSG